MNLMKRKTLQQWILNNNTQQLSCRTLQIFIQNKERDFMYLKFCVEAVVPFLWLVVSVRIPFQDRTELKQFTVWLHIWAAAGIVM